MKIFQTGMYIAAMALMLLSGCGSEQTTQELVDEWQVEVAKYTEAKKAGGDATALAGDHAKARLKVIRRAEKGDPLACISIAASEIGRGHAAERMGNVSERKEAFRSALQYVQCAEKRQTELTETDQRNVQKLLKNLPQYM